MASVYTPKKVSNFHCLRVLKASEPIYLLKVKEKFICKCLNIDGVGESFVTLAKKLLHTNVVKIGGKKSLGLEMSCRG